MVDDLLTVFTDDVVSDLMDTIEDLVATNPKFNEYVRRTLNSRPLFGELLKTEEFKAVGNDFRRLGVDVDLALERIGAYYDWLETLF